jgi:hypothetical protein
VSGAIFNVSKKRGTTRFFYSSLLTTLRVENPFFVIEGILPGVLALATCPPHLINNNGEFGRVYVSKCSFKNEKMRTCMIASHVQDD